MSIRFINKPAKIRGAFDLGLTENYLVDNNFYYNDPVNNLHFNPFENSSLMTSFLFSLGINYKANKKITINLMSGYSQPIIPLVYEWDVGFGTLRREGYVKYLFYNIGIQYFLKSKE